MKHADDDFKFDPDMDIGSLAHACTDMFREAVLKVVFRDEVAEIIPPEYRDKVIYICNPTPPSTWWRPPFTCGWLYPGHKLKQTQKIRKVL